MVLHREFIEVVLFIDLEYRNLMPGSNNWISNFQEWKCFIDTQI